MIVKHETIRAYFENLIMTKLLAYAQNNGFEDLRDKCVVANESYDGKTRKDIKVILKFLSAENTNGIIDLPIQVLVEVNTELQDIVFNILQDIAYEKHQTIETIYFAPNEVDYSFKQFYKTPIVINAFQNGGIYKTSTMTMDMRLVVFETFATTNDMELEFIDLPSGYGDDTDYMDYANNSDEMAAFKSSIINCVYHIEHRFDGIVKKGKKLQENRHNSYNVVFTVSYILNKADEIQGLLWDDADRDVNFQIKYKSNHLFDNAKTYKFRIQTYTENEIVSDVTKVTVTFISTGE